MQIGTEARKHAGKHNTLAHARACVHRACMRMRMRAGGRACVYVCACMRAGGHIRRMYTGMYAGKHTLAYIIY